MSDVNLPWHVVHASLTKQLNTLLDQLEAVEPEALRRLQGEIAGIRFALDVPNQITRDLQSRQQFGDHGPPGY